MEQKNKGLRIIQWAARVLGTLTLAFLLFMVLGEFFGSEEAGMGITASEDMLSLICFPVSTIIGLAISYKWEGIGGIITVIGMISLHIIRPDLASNLLISAFALPGLLYIIYAVWKKRN
jgi:hypothetical protein